MPENIDTAPQDEETLHHAGDKTFKVAMQEKEVALEYMENFLPKLYAHLDTTNFELDNTNYVSKDFKEYYSDVVYRTYLKTTSKKKKPVAIVLLFEHKKTLDSYFLLFLQLLEYITFIWRADCSNKRKPSVIIPIVVFQGKKGLKTKQLHDCFKGISKELLQYIPNLTYHLTSVHDLPDEKLLALDEKNILRSLFLAYTYTEKKAQIHGILIEVFKFFKYRPDRIDFFQLLFDFISKEDYLSADESKELFAHYLSPKEKEGVMTSYQVWKKEGRAEGKAEGKAEGLQEGLHEGEMKKARLVVLRGRWKGASADFLADQIELPYQDVENLFKAYDKVYRLWQKNKDNKDYTPKIEHLSAQEVRYLIDLFNK